MSKRNFNGRKKMAQCVLYLVDFGVIPCRVVHHVSNTVELRVLSGLKCVVHSVRRIDF